MEMVQGRRYLFARMREKIKKKTKVKMEIAWGTREQNRKSHEGVWEEEKVGDKESWNRLVEESIQRVEQNHWRNEMKKKTKLEIYRDIKKDLTMEKYLTNNKDLQGRKLLSQMRMGCSQLEIEVARWRKIPRKIRWCPMCFERTEDEKHFLVQCKWYQEERSKMEEELKIKNWMEMTEEEKAKRILKPKNEREELVVMNFMTKSFKKRQTWIDNN